MPEGVGACAAALATFTHKMYFLLDGREKHCWPIDASAYGREVEEAIIGSPGKFVASAVSMVPRQH